MATRPEDYTVGWICALSVEYVIACELLDEEYERSRAPHVNDKNIYTFGRIHEHHTTITCLAKGRSGTTSAALAAERMRSTFPAISINLMVGIAGAAPSPDNHDVRLGDVVVAVPGREHPGIIQYDFGKLIQNQEFLLNTGHLAPPPDILLGAIHHLESNHQRKGTKIEDTIDRAILKNSLLRPKYKKPARNLDRLCHSTYIHEETECACLRNSYEDMDDGSRSNELVSRKPRHEQGPLIHYGLVASANSLMRDAVRRDALAARYDILCFEMEAAGLENFNCAIIRGISDHADTHKNDAWQGYAAATAASYAKELIQVIPGPVGLGIMMPREDVQEHPQSSTLAQLPISTMDDTHRYDISFSLDRVPLARKFIGREVEMSLLKNCLLPKVDGRRKVFVLQGVGGIGKTQLAVEFMRSNSTDFTAVLWLNASSEDALQRDLASFASKIRPSSDHAKGKADDNGYKVASQEVLDWLSQPANKNWLLIYDNFDHGWSASTLNSAAHDLQQYLPAADHGSIIITTRLVALQQLGEFYELKSVDQSTTHGILRSWYGRNYDASDGERLCECLGGLPLAIAQAGAWLQQSARGIKRYLQLYDQKQHDISGLKQVWNIPLLDYSDRCIWTTYEVSFEAVREQNECATNMLLFWSFLDRRDLFYKIFESAISHTEVSDGKAVLMQTLSRWLGKAATEEFAFDDTMSLLRSYSLIEGFEDTEGYSMHPIVHQWTNLYHGQQKHELKMLAMAVIGLAVPWSSEVGFSTLQLRLLPHVLMCSGKVLDEPDRHEQHIREDMMVQKSRYLVKGISKQGDLFCYNSKWDQAELIYNFVIKVSSEHLARDDLLTLEAIFNLGHVYVERGRLDDARTQYEQALQGRLILYGPDNIRTLRVLKNIGSVLCKQNKLDEAEDALLRVLKGFQKAEETLKPSQRTASLRAMDDLGVLYTKQCRFLEAGQMLDAALLGFNNALGSEHPMTLETIYHLGVLQMVRADYQEAEASFKIVLDEYESIFGVQFAEVQTAVLDTRRSLGCLYAMTDRRLEAKLLFQRTWAGYRRSQGVSSEKCRELEELLALLASDKLPTERMLA